MRVTVSHTLNDLQSDLAKIPAMLVRDGSKIVAKNVRQGNAAARRFARAKSGPHGSSYFKRITGEMTGPLTGEWGPHAGGTPVGAGWRHGPGNTDLPRSADLIGPRFQKDVDGLLDRLFWPGAK